MAFLVVALILVATTALALRSPQAALLTALFFGNWGGLDVDLGLRVTAYQLVMAPLCLVTGLRLLYPGTRPHPLALGWSFAALVLWAVINSAFQVATVPQIEIANSVLRSPVVRATIQIVIHLFTLAPVVLVPWLFRMPEDALRLLKVWFASTLILAVIGFVQFGVWYATGINPLPLGLSNTLLGGTAPVLREGVVAVGTLYIPRMNAFAVEPRFLGTAFGLAMIIIQGLALTLPQVPARRLLGLWLLLFVGLLLTLSTSGIGVWLIGSLTLLPALWLTGVPIRRRTRNIGLATGAIVLPIMLAGLIAESSGVPVVELINDRAIARFTLEAALEDFDLAIVKWMETAPERLWFGVGLGNAHLYATPFLLPQDAAYAEGQVFSAKTLLIRTISEQGIVGFVLLMAFLLSRLIAAAWVRHLPWLAPLLPLTLTLFVMVLASSQLLTEVWFTTGILVMLASHAAATRRRARPMPQPA